MSLKSLIYNLSGSVLVEELNERVGREERLSISGGTRTARAILCSALAKINNSPLLIIVPTLEEASRWDSILDQLGWSKSIIYPSNESTPLECTTTSDEIIWGQMAVLSELNINDKNPDLVIITTQRALEPHLPLPNILKKKIINLQQGLELDIEQLSIKLASLGYSRTSNTEVEGSWSRRGDIIDIFPVNQDLPIRIELFGNAIEKIKEFDPINQRSLEQIENISICPVNIDLVSIDNYEILNNPINTTDDTNIKADKKKSLSNKLKILDLFKKLCAQRASLIDYLNPNTFVVLEEKMLCLSHSKNWHINLDQNYQELIPSVDSSQLKDYSINHIFTAYQDNYKRLNKFKGIETSFETNSSHDNCFDLSSKNIVRHTNQISKISELIKNYQKQKYSIWIVSAQPLRVKALLEEHDTNIEYVQNSSDINGILNTVKGNIPIVLKLKSNVELEGCCLSQWKVILITDKEIFGQELISSRGFIRKRTSRSAKSINPNKIKSGDYVVHRNHGIGRFLKIEKFKLNNEARDYLLVQYADGTLRVAADQLGSLGRYRSASATNPKINKLGGTAWESAKSKAKKAINKVAIDLIKLYAERSNAEGYKFPKDGPWQKEMEDSFPYEPTEDQLKAVSQIKFDMEKNTPMDRLVCGDVGFGKTEVAIRALFKAITSNKQVAILAPTTVLAQQHWRTLRDRFAPYPIKVSLLTRFKSIAERKEIINDLKTSKIDAIVGTHLLLSEKVKYKDLGLLVVDEEQRFGVTQKERIKSLKKNIDVLTLTATPIPRTLYMSLSGVREMSLITTPPPSRRSIKTHLVSMDDEVIRSAISQEIGRGGQVFYVVPKIKNISEIATKLEQMVPNIKLIIAHGKMAEGELENAMIAFNDGEADLMLCTTIIESGLDIPRVNTILIEDAHNFGLSQLYQLRGRVGRSGIQAHAWLFYPKETLINENALKRLKAIQEFSELGSGYQLAMRDMEIRGVGNLIGIEQSGQMEAIGFDLYMEILHESISEIQGQTIPIVEETKVDLPITAFIPSTWIQENEEKISAYKAAAECDSFEALVDLTISWIDRFGPLPSPVESLIGLMRLKLKAKKTGFSRVKQQKPNIVLETLMTEAAFKSLRNGLEPHLHGRVIFKKGEGISEVTFRGLSVLPIEKQIETITEWLNSMEKQIPNLENDVSNTIKSKLGLTKETKNVKK